MKIIEFDVIEAGIESRKAHELSIFKTSACIINEDTLK